MTEPADEAYRIRYWDWCSAKIAEHLSSLSLEEVAERTSDLPGGFWNSMQHLTLQLYRELELPSFEEWLPEYQKNPSLYDKDMLGFTAESDEGAALS